MIKLLLVILLSLFYSYGNAQIDTTFLYKAAAVSNHLLLSKPLEKIYINTNKPNYELGDTIWFKAYLVIGEKHQLSLLSRVLYVDLINPRDSVIVHYNLKLNSGVTGSAIPLAEKLPAGKYRIRAYTNWMRNWGDTQFFNQYFQVGTDFSQIPTTIDKLRLRFFPEGGTLASGVRQRVAFNCIGSDGIGKEIRGVIADDEGNTITEFKTQHLGMGVFVMTPSEGKIYHGKISMADGNPMLFDLPKVVEKGFSLLVSNDTDDSVLVKITPTEQLLKGDLQATYCLVGQQNGKVCYTSAFKLDHPSFSVIVDKKRFITGIAQFTLFSPSGEPLNERGIFIKANDDLKLSVDTIGLARTKRGRVQLSIQAGKPIIATLSISVVNAKEVAVTGNEANLLSTLLLTSGLDGFTDQPGYYFNPINSHADADLDILLLNQDHFKFNWKQAFISAALPQSYNTEDGLTIKGIVKTATNKIAPKVNVNLIDLGEKMVLDTLADADGKFSFKNVDLQDTAKMLIKAGKNNSDYKITFDAPDIPPVEKQTIDSNVAAKVKVQPITNKQQRIIELNMVKLRNYPVLITGISELSVGVNVVNNKLMYQGKPLEIRIDGKLLSQTELSLFSPFHIETIKIAPGIEEEANSNPLLLVTTKTKAGSNVNQLSVVTIKGGYMRKGLVPHSANLNGPGVADQIIDGEDIIGYHNIAELNGMLHNITFVGNPLKEIVNMHPPGGKMSVIFNGTVFNDGFDLLNLEHISSVEVLSTSRSKAIYGDEIGPGGAIIITSKTAQEIAKDFVKIGVTKNNIAGFYTVKPFYNPIYIANLEESTPDLRDAVYWNPDVVTGKDGKASVSWYNTDVAGTYLITIEGIDIEGHLAHTTYSYLVK